MTTHTNKPPPFQQADIPSAKDAFQVISGGFLVAVYTLGVFWALLVRKFGSIGTRAYWFDMCCGYLLIIALAQNPWYPDRYAFQLLWGLLPLLYVVHLLATMASSTHVHTQCVGRSRFPGNDGNAKVLEFVTGLLIGGGFYIYGMVPFGLFIMASATASTVRDALIAERDRQRALKMSDAMWEQQYMMDNFTKHNKGRI